jgi:diguanylate cyclase (GGDEF)-like protein
VSAESLDHARAKVEEQLVVWSNKAQELQREKEKAVQELLTVVAGAAESTGLRDEKFGREIAELSDRLRAVAGLESLPLMRRSIVENASALNTCVARMTDEGRESIRRLTFEIAEYRTRLKASERRAMIDPLTGLCNRRGIEQHLEIRIAAREPFSLLIADLNGFKAINDRHGHLVGDEILRRFGAEIRAQFPSEDTVARWGGDEFVALVAGSESEVRVRTDRVRHWVLGEYKIEIEGLAISVMVDAALGMAAWDGIETGMDLFERADKDLYREKAGAREMAKAS